MMKKLLILLLLFGFLITPSIKADTVLYCQSELETGLIQVNGSWETKNFISERFTIKFNDDYSRLEGLDPSPGLECRASFTSSPHLIFCVDRKYNHSTFRYSKKTKRFVHYFNPFGGYVENKISDTDNDVIYAGTCKIF